MNTLLRKIEVKLNYVQYALEKMNKPHLGDFVTYKGKRCWLNQGVNNPYWDLAYYEPGSDSATIFSSVHASEFQLDRSLKRKLWAFRSSYKFKMSNWYTIDTWGRKLGDSISSY